MIRFIINNISTKLAISPIKYQSAKPLIKICNKFVQLNNSQHRCMSTKSENLQFLSSDSKANSSSTSAVLDQNPFDSDEYLLNSENFPQKQFIRIRRKDLCEELKNAYMTTDEQAKKIFTKEIKIKENCVDEISQTLKLLVKYNFSQQTVIDNSWIIAMRSKILQSKIDIIKTIDVRDINDFIPFFRLSVTRLLKLISFIKKDNKNFLPKYENRIYYISDCLELEPKIITKYVSKRLFILFMPSESLQENLNNMIKYGIEPISIIKDLWAFRYNAKAVKARLERVKEAQKDKVMPWMVRCPERILERSLQLSVDERKLLGDMDSIVEYISYRLGYDIETTRAIMYKHPAVLRVRATKVKEVLDFLLNEAEFEPYQIAQVPRILCHSLDTTKKRFEELKSYGCKPSSLIILCRSLREYKKFLQNWITVYEKLKKKTNVEITEV